MNCALHQEHDCLLVELLLCFTAEEAVAEVDKGFPRWYSMKNIAAIGDYHVLSLAPHTIKSAYLDVEKGNTRPVALLIHYLEGLVTNF